MPLDTAAATRARTRTSYDLAQLTTTVSNADGVEIATYSAKSFSFEVIHTLALVGLATVLRNSTTPAEAHAKLAQGELPFRAPAKRELDPWRQAIANATVAAAEEAGKPVAQDEAEARARAMDHVRVRALKQDPAVVAAHARLSGRASTLLAD